MTGVFLQVRLDSQRLPGKALLELEGVTVVEHAMRSLRRVPGSVHALLTDRDSSGDLGPLASACGFQLFVGPKENVLERFVTAAEQYAVITVVRATGDNPLVSWEMARLALREYAIRNTEYFAFDGLPLGTGVEIVSSQALERSLDASELEYDLEHVTPHVYNNPERFRCARVCAPPAFCVPEARVTLDTSEDYEILKVLFAELYSEAPIPLALTVRYLRSEQRLRGEGVE